MAVKRQRKFMIVDGPGMLELQFSEFNPQGHVVEFMVEETGGAEVPGEVFSIISERKIMHCQVTGSDRIERRMKDALGRELPPGARRIRVRQGVWPLEGWYEPLKRKGLLREAQGFRNGVPPKDFVRRQLKVPVV